MPSPAAATSEDINWLQQRHEVQGMSLVKQWCHVGTTQPPGHFMSYGSALHPKSPSLERASNPPLHHYLGHHLCPFRRLPFVKGSSFFAQSPSVLSPVLTSSNFFRDEHGTSKVNISSLLTSSPSVYHVVHVVVMTGRQERGQHVRSYETSSAPSSSLSLLCYHLNRKDNESCWDWHPPVVATPEHCYTIQR